MDIGLSPNVDGKVPNGKVPSSTNLFKNLSLFDTLYPFHLIYKLVQFSSPSRLYWTYKSNGDSNHLYDLVSHKIGFGRFGRTF